jgi:hypothetical protein
MGTHCRFCKQSSVTCPPTITAVCPTCITRSCGAYVRAKQEALDAGRPNTEYRIYFLRRFHSHTSVLSCTQVSLMFACHLLTRRWSRTSTRYFAPCCTIVCILSTFAALHHTTLHLSAQMRAQKVHTHTCSSEQASSEQCFEPFYCTMWRVSCQCWVYCLIADFAVVYTHKHAYKHTHTHTHTPHTQTHTHTPAHSLIHPCTQRI